ncbi:MAG: hypothetical protein WCK58_12310, partial [Chloroflexota bacterium]
LVDRLVVVDGPLAASLAERDEAERPAVVERALRIGLLALADAASSMDVDVVRREFEKLVAQTSAANADAARAVEEVLRTNFGDGDGRLPRTLERFLGNRGALQTFVGDLFDETKRDSAIGRMRTLLGTYFDGDGSRLAQLLDPTRLGSPLHQFRQEMSEGFTRLNERLTAIEAASRARADERSRSAAKGADFEDLLHGMLSELSRGSGDLVDRTGTETGAVAGSKKGDFVLTLDHAVTRGADVRIVVEAKDRSMSPRQMRDELREARANRGATVAIAAWSTAHAPREYVPFAVVGDDVHVAVDPEAPDSAYLAAAVRIARLLAVARLAEREVEVDAAAVAKALTGVREQLDMVRQLKTQLTSINTVTKGVADGLEAMRMGILAKVADAEAELRITGSTTA